MEQFDPKKRKLGKEARAKLSQYHWPGNVRELVNVIKTAIARCHEDEIQAEHLNITVSESRCNYSIAESEKESIIAALKRNGNNKSRAAQELGMSRKTLYNKIEDYHIEIG